MRKFLVFLSALLISGTCGLFADVSANAFVDLTGLEEYEGIRLASGASVTADDLMNESLMVSVLDYGAVSLEMRDASDTDTHAVENTEAFNTALADIASQGGGTLVVPQGTFRVYTIELQSNVNIYLEKGAVIQAARTRTFDRNGNITGEAEDFNEDGSPGNYLQPEVNIYAGLQDGGHTYFANSLLYAADKENIMIYGEGLIDGSQMNDEGVIEQIGRPDEIYNHSATEFVCNFIGDINRLSRDFLVAVLKECLQPDVLLKLPELARIFTENVDTDLSVGNILAFAQLAIGMDPDEDVTIASMPWSGVWYNGASLVVAQRDELLEMLNEYMEKDENRAVVISSHISGDLEGLCDDIYMIDEGRIVLHEDTDVLMDSYAVLKVDEEQFKGLDKSHILRVRREPFGYSCLTGEKNFYTENCPGIVVERGGIDSVMTLMIKGEEI